MCAAPTTATSSGDAAQQPEILHKNYSWVGGVFAVYAHKGLGHTRNAHHDGDGDAARARGSGDTELSTSVWSGGDVTGGNRRRPRRLIVADQKDTEAELNGLAKDCIYGAYATAGVAVEADKNDEDPELYARLGYGVDGVTDDAGQHQGRALGSAKRGAARAHAQTSPAVAALVKAEETTTKNSLANITSRHNTLQKAFAELAEEKKTKKRRRRWRRQVPRVQRR